MRRVMLMTACMLLKALLAAGCDSPVVQERPATCATCDTFGRPTQRAWAFALYDGDRVAIAGALRFDEPPRTGVWSATSIEDAAGSIAGIGGSGRFRVTHEDEDIVIADVDLLLVIDPDGSRWERYSCAGLVDAGPAVVVSSPAP